LPPESKVYHTFTAFKAGVLFQCTMTLRIKFVNGTSLRSVLGFTAARTL